MALLRNLQYKYQKNIKMGAVQNCYQEIVSNFIASEPEIKAENNGNELLSHSEIKEIKREKIDNEKFNFFFQINQTNENIENSPIQIEVIHVKSTESTMPASREYIDQGNKLPFIYNTEIQTAGVGKGNRKWAGMIEGNLYTSSCIPNKMIKYEISSKEDLVKITAISIIQILRKYTKDQFFLKYPNDIICKDKRKLGGIIAESYKDFWIIGFGINIVDKPDEGEIRKEGLKACFIKEHLPDLDENLKALELSINVTKQIIYNLNKITHSNIDKVFDEYIIK